MDSSDAPSCLGAEPMVAGTLGVGFAVLAAVALAAQSLAVRVSTRTRSLTDLVAGVFAVNLLVLLPVTAVVYGPPYGLTARSVVAFAVGGLLGSLLARVALFVGIQRLGASRAEPLKSTFPLVAVLGAVLLLDEPLTTTLAVGVVLLVGGAVAVSWDTRASPSLPRGDARGSISASRWRRRCCSDSIRCSRGRGWPRGRPHSSA
ncbi:EamA family transporter [Halomicroarcula sp. GCM10025709]|uniref:EamA family transporter n=1 Tax=Halomicroarcula sp. GCM10025709 TaxID=3252669 RepID=UPI003605F088